MCLPVPDAARCRNGELPQGNRDEFTNHAGDQTVLVLDTGLLAKLGRALLSGLAPAHGLKRLAG